MLGRAWTCLLLTVLAAAIWPLPPTAAQDLRIDDGHVASLKGRLLRPVAPALTTASERDESYPALEVQQPVSFICVSDPYCEEESSQYAFQLALDEAQWAIFERHEGKPALVMGTPFHAITGHHYTPVLLAVDRLIPLPELRAFPLPDGDYIAAGQSCEQSRLPRLSVSQGTATARQGGNICAVSKFSLAGRILGLELDCGASEAGRAMLELQPNDTIHIGAEAYKRCDLPPPADTGWLVEKFVEASRPSAPPATLGSAVSLQLPHADQLFYGSRAGMQVTVAATTGIGSSKAEIAVVHTARNAAAFCRDYVGAVTAQCVTDALKTDLSPTIAGDCLTGEFIALDGALYTYLDGYAGEKTARRILSQRDKRVLDGSSASGYDVVLGQFEALCPQYFGKSADELIALDGYDAQFDRLAQLRDAPLAAGPLLALPIIRFATRARPIVAELVLERLAGTPVATSGQYGFAASCDSAGHCDAALLVDYARRELQFCATTSDGISYRFGTLIEDAFEGLAVPCPASLELALAEFLPSADDAPDRHRSDRAHITSDRFPRD